MRLLCARTLAEPVAVLPSVPVCLRLVNLFLAGRSPRTLAAYQADLEDFRRYTRTPTLANTAHWLLEDLAFLGAIIRRPDSVRAEPAARVLLWFPTGQ
jgi:hypothetical protein